jgi:hypothetical protein
MKKAAIREVRILFLQERGERTLARDKHRADVGSASRHSRNDTGEDLVGRRRRWG